MTDQFRDAKKMVPTAPLSPAARAVLNATNDVRIDVDWWPEGMPQLIAAALRAAANQLGYEVLGVRCVDCSQIELIAAELEDAQ